MEAFVGILGSSSASLGLELGTFPHLPHGRSLLIMAEHAHLQVREHMNDSTLPLFLGNDGKSLPAFDHILRLYLPCGVGIQESKVCQSMGYKISEDHTSSRPRKTASAAKSRKMALIMLGGAYGKL